MISGKKTFFYIVPPVLSRMLYHIPRNKCVPIISDFQGNATIEKPEKVTILGYTRAHSKRAA